MGPTRASLPRALGHALRRMPTAAWVCAAVACLNAAAWSIATPPFMGPDEEAHFAYTEVLAEDGRLPLAIPEYPEAEELVRADLQQPVALLNPAQGLVGSRGAEETLRRDLERPIASGGVGAGTAGSEPPLYYAIETVPYRLGAPGGLIVSLELMRLVSALLAGVTALLVVLFLREALPGVPWAWSVGGLCVALAPLPGSISAIVNPDVALATVSAGLFYALSRAFRRGFTPRLATVIGGLVVAGLGVKLNFLGLVPGIALAMALLTWSRARSRGLRAAGRSLAIGGGLGISPILVYGIVKAYSPHPVTGLVLIGKEIVERAGGPLAAIGYVWQLYLPRLPGMSNDFPGISTTREIWLRGLVGKYNWLETVFPPWVYSIALIPVFAIALLFVRELIRSREALRARLSELAAYAAIAVGLIVLIGLGSYLVFPASQAAESEPRYLLPLLPIGAAVLALAARGAGRRWGPVAGALLVLLVLAHDIFSQLLEISRFYV